MRVVILPDARSVSLRAADLFCELIQQYPDAVLGLATGSTPLGTYQELIRRNRAGEVSFSEVTSFNLDEYVGLPQQHPQSYYAFMHANFFGHVDIDPGRCYLPCGQSEDLEEECRRYEQLIDEEGPIDLQILASARRDTSASTNPVRRWPVARGSRR